MSGGSRLVGLAGCALVLAYALPLFLPPTTPSLSPSTGLLARQFPGVPQWWIAARLACLACGSALVARAASRPVWSDFLSRTPEAPARARDGAARHIRQVACFFALAHASSAPMVARLSVVGQTLYLAALGAPAALLAVAHVSSEPPRRRWPRMGASAWLVVVVIAVWAPLRFMGAWHSPRSADVVDLWRTFGYLVRFSQGGGNFLSEAMDPELPGVTAMPLVFQGLPLMTMLGAAPTLGWVQVASVLWVMTIALGVAVLATIAVGRTSAPVAAAVFLWAPFTLTMPLYPSPLFVGSLFTVTLWLLVAAFHRYRSSPALAGFGAVAGVAITYPSLVPMTLLAASVVAWSWYRGSRVPPIVIATAVFSFLAGCIPGLPGGEALRAMWNTYAAPAGHLSVLQDVLFGQVPAVQGAATAFSGVRATAFDVPIATLLSPVAVARTPIRLWGDTLFDPLGCGLCAIGIAVSLRFARREATGTLLLAALAAALVPGFVSSYDRPSLLRVFALPVPVALLAATGFAALAIPVKLVSPAATATAAAVMAGGMLLFDVVNPRILRQSGVGLAIRSLSVDDLDRATVLTARDEDAPWLYLDTIASQVPPRPIAVLDAQHTEELLAAAEPPHGREEILLWTPAVEDAAGVSRRVCTRWSTAALYALSDRTGLTKLLAARPLGHGWIPRLARGQWRVEQCTTAGERAIAATVRPPPSDSATFALTGGSDLRTRDLTGADLRGAKLQGTKLAGALMREAKLERADLSGADLRGAILVGADLHGADLGGAAMAKADMSRALLVQANLEGADLNSAILTDADLTEARFARAHMGGADLRGAHLAGADFSDAQLTDAKLSKTDLSGAVMTGTNLRTAILDGADLAGADLRRGDIAGATLTGARLHGIDASGLILRDVDLSGADLTSAKLVASDLGGANLRGANLADATLTNARLSGASLVRADLRRAVLRDADLTGADLTGALLSGTDLTGTSIAGAKLDGLTLSGANLAGAGLSNIKLPGAKLTGTVLTGADLHGCDLRGADLGGADLAGARLTDCDLTGASMHDARLAGVDVRGAVMDDADLAGVVLTEMDLGGQRMRKARLHGANLSRSNLAGADLREADLSGADLRDATLTGARLAGANLRAAKLGGAMLSGSDLSGANLGGADVYRAYLADVVWAASRCPDESISSDHGETCCGHYRGGPPDSCSP